MAIVNKQFDIGELASVDANGITVALFPQIKDALAREMKRIYGSDIDISSASADGQFIMTEALVLNNIYRSLEALSSSLNPASASGSWLDVLAQLSGTNRRSATYSTANLYIKSNQTSTPAYLEFKDKNGNIWWWRNRVDMSNSWKVTFKANEVVPIAVTCKELGAVVAVSQSIDDVGTAFAASDNEWGDIYQCVQTGYAVRQNGNATVGLSDETDGELRARRLKSIGVSGRTVTDSLRANLLSLPGVWDAKVVANGSASNVTDGDLTIPAHCVEVVVAPQNGVSLSAPLVGECIYKSLTPGILADVTGSPVNGEIKTETLHATSQLACDIKWKQCTLCEPKITITFELLNNTLQLSDAQKSKIVDAMFAYLNGVSIGEAIDCTRLRMSAEATDERTKVYGLPTFSVKGVYNGDNTSTTNIISGKIELKNSKCYYKTDKWSGNTLTIGA